MAMPHDALTPPAVSRPDWAHGAAWDVSGVDVWNASAAADYRLCRVLADRFGATLFRSLRVQRVGWETNTGPAFALVLPNAQFMSYVQGDEWMLYHLEGERVFHQTLRERERGKTLLLPDCADDWAGLLTQALQGHVWATRYAVTPHHVNALGEIDAEPTGYVFTLEACAPPDAVCVAPLCLTAVGSTPEEAARAACVRWLQGHAPDIAPAAAQSL